MKRFYRLAGTAPVGAGWQVMLDGRAVKTVGGQAQVVPSRALAEAMAAEWAAQGEVIDPALLCYRDLADYALDVVAPDPGASVAALMPYGESDTLCYRADPDAPLYPRQVAVWEPILSTAEAQWQVQFVRVSGIVHRAQPPATLATLQGLASALDPFALAALRSLAGLAASLVLGLLALAPGADLEALWDAAELEEEWQAQLWGREAEAEARRAHRRGGFMAAARFGELARGQAS